MSKTEIGMRGEQKAVELLKKEGFKILGRGEQGSDIIAVKENVKYLIDVKYSEREKPYFHIAACNLTQALRRDGVPSFLFLANGITQFYTLSPEINPQSRIDGGTLRLSSESGKLTLMIPDELDKRLRVEIAKRMGGRKGDLTKAVIEAIELWLEKTS